MPVSPNSSYASHLQSTPCSSPVGSAYANILHDPYPGGIPCPFPFSAPVQNVLCSNQALNENRPVYLIVIREVCEILEQNLKRKPNHGELLHTAKLLCREYPVLQNEDDTFSEGNPSKGVVYKSLYSTLRKRFNNLSNNRKIKKKQLLKKLGTGTQSQG